MQKSLGETLCALRRAAGYTQPRVSELLAQRGVEIRTAGISKWEKGLTQPSASQFLALCAIYGVTDVLSEFTDEPTPLSRLNAEGRRLAADYVRLLDRSGLYARTAPAGVLRLLPLYDLAASAGTGEILSGDGYEMVPAGAEVPESAAFGVRIAGDSMEPDIPDGSVVWVRRCETLPSGRVGVFDLDGRAYCKRLEQDAQGARLVSLNPKYAPIPLSASAEARVFGEVVAVTAQPAAN